MKKAKAILVSVTYLLGAVATHAALVFTTGIPENDFNEAFQNDRIWYAQFQPGGPGESNNPGDTHPLNEFEIGGDSLRYYEGNTTTIYDEANNPFEVHVSDTAFLSATFNGATTPEGSQYGITEAFNTIWIGLKSDFFYGVDETLDVINHSVDNGNMSFFPTMHVGPGEWIAFKVFFDDSRENIGSLTITGDLVPDMRFGGALSEDWTYTVFATYDPSIVPEPSSIALLTGWAVILFSFASRRRNLRI